MAKISLNGFDSERKEKRGKKTGVKFEQYSLACWGDNNL